MSETQRKWMTPEEADAIVSDNVRAMILEGLEPEVITVLRDHLRATLSPLVRVEAEEENETVSVIEFPTWPDAFDYCREANRPVVFRIGGEVWKIYPSGHYQKVQP